MIISGKGWVGIILSVSFFRQINLMIKKLSTGKITGLKLFQEDIIQLITNSQYYLDCLLARKNQNYWHNLPLYFVNNEICQKMKTFLDIFITPLIKLQTENIQANNQ